MIGLLQFSKQRSESADRLLSQLPFERGIDIMLLREQYRDKQAPLWFSDASGPVGNPSFSITVKATGTSGKEYEVHLLLFLTLHRTNLLLIYALEYELRIISGRIIVAVDFSATMVDCYDLGLCSKIRFVLIFSIVRV